MHRKIRHTKLSTLLLSLLVTFNSIGQGSFKKDDFSVTVPPLCIKNTPATVHIEYKKDTNDLAQVTAIINGEREILKFVDGHAEVEVVFDRKEPFSLKIDGYTYVEDKSPMPLWLSIIPPLLVIVFAFVFREVISSLTIGIIAGIGLMEFYADAGSVFAAFPRLIDTYLVNSLADKDHVAVILFSTIIGGMVAVISKNGGMAAIVTRLSKKATNPRRGQLVTWFLGLAIFFDDYANTLVVGNTMRPLTDRLKISREKLSYIVDSTAAPVAAIAFITTWIGAELGYIQGAWNQRFDSSLPLSEQRTFFWRWEYQVSRLPGFRIGLGFRL